MDIDHEKLTGNPFVVGALGAAVTALRFTPGAAWWERLLNVLAGAMMAGFLSPALVHWLGLGAPHYASGAAFLIGLLGMSLAASALEWVRDGGLRRVVESVAPGARKE
jgi:uncharacterized protein involved in response to NO